MDEAHLAAAVRYVALNPVRARLVRQPTDWRWSSVHAHLSGTDDGITALSPILERFPRFAEFIETEPDPAVLARLRCAESIGRPLGDKAFINRLEAERRRAGGQAVLKPIQMVWKRMRFCLSDVRSKWV